MATKNSKNQKPESQNPEPVKIKVGDIVTIKPMVGVVYENGNKDGGFRVQLADGTKIKFIQEQFWTLAAKPVAMVFLKTAPELKPEAIIAREAEENDQTVEDFMAGVAGGHEPLKVEENDDAEDNSDS